MAGGGTRRWGVMATTTRSRWSAVSRKHLGYYLDEFTFRFNSPTLKEPGQALLSPRAAGQDGGSSPIRPYRSSDQSESEGQTTICWDYLSQADTHLLRFDRARNGLETNLTEGRGPVTSTPSSFPAGSIAS